jgi:GDPmannose 4,6-dehydratase
MLQRKKPEDYVIATGKQYSVKEFINLTAKELKIRITWKGKGMNEKGYLDNKVIIEIDKNYFRPTEVEALLGNSNKARKKLNWKPKISFKELVREMINADLKIAKNSD